MEDELRLTITKQGELEAQWEVLRALFRGYHINLNRNTQEPLLLAESRRLQSNIRQMEMRDMMKMLAEFAQRLYANLKMKLEQTAIFFNEQAEHPDRNLDPAIYPLPDLDQLQSELGMMFTFPELLGRLQELISHGVPIDDMLFDEIINDSMRRNNIDLLELILALPKGSEAIDDDFQHYFLKAAANDYVDVVSFFLSHPKFHPTPTILMAAVGNNRVEIVEMLLDDGRAISGGLTSSNEHKLLLDSLFIASNDGDSRMLMMILNRGIIMTTDYDWQIRKVLPGWHRGGGRRSSRSRRSRRSRRSHKQRKTRSQR